MISGASEKGRDFSARNDTNIACELAERSLTDVCGSGTFGVDTGAFENMGCKPYGVSGFSLLQFPIPEIN